MVRVDDVTVCYLGLLPHHRGAGGGDLAHLDKGDGGGDVGVDDNKDDDNYDIYNNDDANDDNDKE